MPREIKDPSEITQPPSPEQQDLAATVGDEPQRPKSAQKPVTFIKNHLNEQVILPDGSKYKFEKPKLVTTDKKLIDGLKAVASRHNILVCENE